MRLTKIRFNSNDPNLWFFFVRITDSAGVCKAQNLSCKISFPESETVTNTDVTTFQESRKNKKKGKLTKIDFLE